MFRFALALATLAAAVPCAARTSPAPACTSLPGLAPLLAPQTRFVLFGEYHGTVEIPGIVADALCSAVATRRPVVLGVEFDRANQPWLDAYLRSAGNDTARAALVAAPAWREEGGRATEAILALIESARRLAHAGADVAVLAFDPVSIAGTSAEREAGMAALLREAADRRPGMLVIALTGAGHAGRARWTSYTPAFDSLGGLLPREATLAFAFLRPGGSYWGCRSAEGAREGCKPYAMPMREPLRPRGVWRDTAAREGFDGLYSAGTAYTASRPAKAAEPPISPPAPS